MEILCPDCFLGDGKCIHCDGTGDDYGLLSELGSIGDGDLMDCSYCNGTGVCNTCDGSGFIEEDDDD